MISPLKYLPSEHNKQLILLKKKNDKLHEKLMHRKKFWLSEYESLCNNLLHMNFSDLKSPIKINELEGATLIKHEMIRNDLRKIITQIEKNNIKKKEVVTDLEIFYSVRKKELNILRGDYCINTLINGVMSEYNRTNELYGAFGDFLSDIKDLLYQLKFKITKSVSINNETHLNF